ncbi:hypothetical protein K0C01_07540 [Salinarchaeum sp. IM2453]|uniref:hypothetical protein n=1 Tax=Salinarchaeum sp. IM2453 TaxID=2862870 RepID=UPI001C82A31B|nr:hypothetical protein [Salinarchaeum sp. IM2453]QZA87660.1 hypothetical protein K0C01_07540 [Salinarchaeum sp. IM2453]
MSFSIILVFGILLLPLYLVIAGWILGKPRDYRTAGLGVVFMISIVAVLIAGTFVVSLTEFILPS